MMQDSMNGMKDSMPAGVPASSGADQMGSMPTVQEVAAALMQGVSPDELMEMGVPQELIMEAIGLLEQAMAAEQQQVPMEEPGAGLGRMMSVGK